ncbi:MAG: tetratricopeptide repeat protein, partial [Ramlibacter sp.]|nr:tetratricopeptide repeat protein [Ramlibacter sp.]
MGRSIMRSAEALSQTLAAAVDLLRSERIDEAESALQEVLQRSPDQPDALHFLGVLRHTQGEMDEAVSLIQRALAAMPNNASAWNNLGNVLLLAGRGEDAADAYDHAVTHGEGTDAVRALNNLGVLHRKLGRLDRSELALRDAVERDPAFADAWYNLSTTLIMQGRVHDGLVAHSKAVALWPEDVQSRQEVIRALLLLDERERAARLLREWLASEPGNAVAQHMLAACEGESETPDRASNAYVQQVFDGFAASFDAKLEALDYRAPALVVEALRRAVGADHAALDIVDAGCGTGLCGIGLKPWARTLAGCDLSVGMLRRAKARNVYDVLHQAELTHYLNTQPEAFDAVVSADTLCYFGALEGVLAAARRSLRAGGWLIFTVEALNSEDERAHVLQTNGRYAHCVAYLWEGQLQACYDVLELVPHTLRQEVVEPVRGWLVMARR